MARSKSSDLTAGRRVESSAMGRKHHGKNHETPPSASAAATPSKNRGSSSARWRRRRGSPRFGGHGDDGSSTPSRPDRRPGGAAHRCQRPRPTPEVVAEAGSRGQARAAQAGRLAAHSVPGIRPAAPAEVVTAAYQFAAEHPEVLSYVPCFCGCEQAATRATPIASSKSRAPTAM